MELPEDDPALSRPTVLKGQREPVLSASVSGRHNRNRVSIIRSDIRVPERSEGGFPVGARIILTLDSFIDS